MNEVARYANATGMNHAGTPDEVRSGRLIMPSGISVKLDEIDERDSVVDTMRVHRLVLRVRTDGVMGINGT